jgi:hypothetical protein
MLLSVHDPVVDGSFGITVSYRRKCYLLPVGRVLPGRRCSRGLVTVGATPCELSGPPG